MHVMLIAHHFLREGQVGRARIRGKDRKNGVVTSPKFWGKNTTHRIIASEQLIGIGEEVHSYAYSGV